MVSPLALVDLAAILPFYLSLYIAVDLRFLRGLRLLRLFKLARYSPALGALLDVMRKESEALLAAFVVLLILLMVSAAGIYVLEHDVQPESFGSIPASMWWAIVTLTTLGYGDVVPVTTGGRILGGIIGVLGVGMIALPAAIMASGFADSIHARKAQYSRYAKHFLHDGVLDEQERWQLEELRKELGIDSDEALEQLRSVMEQLKEAGPTRCPHCGKSLSGE
jgi:voltage-gated potassium channel